MMFQGKEKRYKSQFNQQIGICLFESSIAQAESLDFEMNGINKQGTLFFLVHSFKIFEWCFMKCPEMHAVKNKHLMTGRKGNSKFCFPETLNEVEGKQNSLFPAGPVIQCLVIPPNTKLEKKM